MQSIKRMCKYCDILEDCNFVCAECRKNSCKKEWAIVRHLRSVIHTPFEFNSSKMLQGCSKKRPDVYFDLPTHCLIVEIDENQHREYGDSCECARISEIVSGIGGRPVTIIRYNPDVVTSRTGRVTVAQKERVTLLVDTVKRELVRQHDAFSVRIIQLYYNDALPTYLPTKEEDITSLVAV
jgi:very-short-patch-repair endonuclease